MELLADCAKSFLVGGLLCAAGQLLIDRTRLTPARILTAYVVAGVLTVAYAALVVRAGVKRRQRIESGELDPAALETPDDSAQRAEE